MRRNGKGSTEFLPHVASGESLRDLHDREALNLSPDLGGGELS